ncbi:PIN-like domain-containing protein [Mesorhizobium sp. 1B3]|uniref:PIN-like domain-containing protein n=1 Tax=Mesorhizobium sp. 1B3 TaxID=3243599 RepID=UPI003D99191E
MRLDPLVRDYPSYLDDLIRALSDPKTRVYLDTSLLMWLIRIGADARAEFMVWAASRPAGAVRVPVWAAHELHKHLSANTIPNNVSATIREAMGKYDEFVWLAAERADEDCSRRGGFTGRVELLSALSLSHTQVARIAKAISVEDAQIRAATEEVIAFANDRMMDTDVSAILQTLNEVGQFRYDHRVPPGFQDNKPENRFGDVILWEEILADMAAAGQTKAGNPRRTPLATNAVFVSRDKKPDWVSAARWLSGVGPEASKADRNFDLDVALPHPMLLHEFRRRTGGDKVFITHPAFLATTLDLAARRSGSPSPSRIWQAATHRLDLVAQLDKRLQPFGEAPVVVQPEAPPPPSEPAPPTALDWDSFTVRQVATPSVSAEVDAILNALPAEAEAAIAALLTPAGGTEIDGVRLGRVFAELTVAEASGWPERLPLYLEKVRATSEQAAQLALLAFASSAVFDRFDENRREPEPRILQAVLGLENDPRMADAFRTIGRLVEERGVRLPYVPGSGANVRYTLELGPAPAPFRIRAIRLGGQAALLANLPANSERTLTRLLGRPPTEGCTGRDLRLLLARTYLTPVDRLSSEFDARALTWTEDSGLQPLDTGGDGGIGQDLDTDDYD